MMPLTLASVGEENMIKKVGGSPETRKFLESLGFVAGGSVTVVSEIAGTTRDAIDTPFTYNGRIQGNGCKDNGLTP